MKSNTAKKMMEWQQKVAANKEETILGAHIAWRHIDDEKGRGVFALRDIKKGEIIETAPVVPIPASAVPEDGSNPDGYLFDWDEDTEDEEHCMPLGYLMLYNHSNKANMDMESDLGEYTITVKAKRDIKMGEELTWDYACDIWFDEA